MPQYHCQCDNCDRETYSEEYTPSIECVCSIGVQTYRGYRDDNYGYFRFIPEEQSHYLVGQDQNLYYYDQGSQSWYARGSYPPPVFEPLDEVLEEVAEVQLYYPESTDGVSVCQAGWSEYGIVRPNQRNSVKGLIEAEVYNSRPEAWAMLARWNRAFPEGRIAMEEVGLRPEDDRPATPPPSLNQLPVVPANVTVDYGGQQHNLNLFSSAGGFHTIYSPSGPGQMVHGATNDTILVRIPKSDAPSPYDGARMGDQWAQSGFQIPRIYNRGTLLNDRFYIVELVPHAFNPGDSNHVRQVKQVLTQMSQSRTGPDFRPDNVRFRENGQMVLIDFSENPGVQETENFGGLMKDFTQQFAAGSQVLYEQLRVDMHPNFRDEMDHALFEWQM